MKINIESIKCPSCGSSDVTMNTKTAGVCNVCGSQISVTQDIIIQNLNIGQDLRDDDNNLLKIKLINKQLREDFLRRTWLEIIKNDPPQDIFNYDFGEIKTICRDIFFRCATVDMSYSASVGHDRQEPYIAYETYYEEVRNGDRTERVRKERPVTKYRTVTDWSAVSGNYSAATMGAADNNRCDGFSNVAFLYSMAGVSLSIEGDNPDIALLSDSECAALQVDKEAEAEVDSLIETSARRELEESLPGDHKKNISVTINGYADSHDVLCQTEEYETEISYEGKKYKNTGFTFGYMMGHNELLFGLKNDKSLESIIKAKKDSIEPAVSKEIYGLSLITIGVIALSIIMSLFVHYYAAIVPAAMASLVMFIFRLVKESQTRKRIKAEVEKECAECKTNYKQKLLDKLNNKLSSLSLKPATWEEAYNVTLADSFEE